MSVTCRSLTQPPEQNHSVDSESHLVYRAAQGGGVEGVSRVVVGLSHSACLSLQRERGKCFSGIAFLLRLSYFVPESVC